MKKEPLGMRYIYFGSSRFARLFLEGACAGGAPPVLVVSQPDKPKGRGLKMFPTEVSSYAQVRTIPLIKPSSLKDREVIEQLSREKPALIVVADYGKKIPQSVFSIPRHFSVGIHPSLLPCYRGAAPIDWALINGEQETGVSIFKINEHIDAGEILLQKKVPISEDDTVCSLIQKLAEEAAVLFFKALQEIRENSYTLRPQDNQKASFAPRLTKEDGRIFWDAGARHISNLIRGTLGWPSAYTYYHGKMVKILAAEPLPSSVQEEPGTIVKIDKEGICVAAFQGILKITKVKPEGRREMTASDFVCGYRLRRGDTFSRTKE